MGRYILKRVLMLIPVILGVTFMVYFIMDFAPGDTALSILGITATDDELNALREQLGLNRPVWQRYLSYMWDLLHGDMGTSWRTGRDVFNEIIIRLPATAQLGFWSVLLGVVIAVPAGIISAVKQYSIWDVLSMIVALLGVATPNFWIGLMLIIWFSLNLRWLPTGGMGTWKNLVMPVITLGTSGAASICRMTRSSMLEVIHQDYIRTAKAKGVSASVVIRKHALRNALLPTVTTIGMQLGVVMGGSVLVETVFSWPGVGNFMVDSIKNKDTPAALGCIVLLTVWLTVMNLFVDILYGFIDPRIKAQYKG